MDALADIHLTRGDTSQNSLAESFTVDHEHELGNAARNGDSVPDNPNSSSSNVHLSFVTDGSDIETHEAQSPPLKSDQELSDVQTVGNRIYHDHNCTHPQSNSDPDIIPVVPAGGSSSSTNINDSEAHTIIDPQEPPLLRARTVSSATTPREEGEAGSVDLTGVQMPHTELDHVHHVGLARLTDEEETREDCDYPCDLPSSLPPSSSPPQFFSSSPPYASSQSSASGVEPSKMVLAVELEGCASSQGCPHGNHVVSVAQDESCLESKNLHSDEICDVATSPETAKYCLQVDPTPCIDGHLGSSRKRITYQNDLDESYGPQPIKRPQPDSGFYPPPTPKRATLASQNRQFKKLTAPFRPPSKLPVVTDGLAQTMNNKEAESIISTTPERSRDKIDIKGSTSTTHVFPLQHKASNTSRSVTQFKSPLINRVLPADSRTIRLTPVLQTLERKLQLLKRAIKIKEDKEEEVLTRLAGKWIEAGREVAYDVWDATKDAGDFEGKATSIRRSYGWESTSNGNVPWGWDNKPGDAGEESCDLDPSVAASGAERLVPDEDEDARCNTLGTMLHQLGIALETFGWDDDKETFSD